MNRLSVIVGAVILSGIVATTNAEAKMQNLQMDESVWSITDKYDRTIESLEKINAVDTTLIIPDPKVEALVNGKYKVIKGDTIPEIAEKCDVSVKQIHHLNHITEEQKLTEGRTLQVNVN